MISTIGSNIIPIALTAVSLLAVIMLIFIYWRPVKRVTREAARQEQTDDPELTSENCQPVSVIVFATDGARTLDSLLGDILAQSYGAPFEVIVVNDGASDYVSRIVDRYRATHPNLYDTFTPKDARNVSRKKLGLTLGIKAARYPIVVITTARTVIPSPLWLARMTRPFNDPSVQVVIGLAMRNWSEDKQFGHGGRGFTESADAITWLSSAIAGKPYRGIENNLAFSRRLFFDNRGYSRSFNLTNGDDDIFISEIARPDNTAVVLHSDANVIRDTTDPRRNHNETRMRYAFTGRLISKTLRRQLAFGSWMLWAQLLTAIMAIAITLPSLIRFPWGSPELPIPWLEIAIPSVALILTILTWVMTTMVWRRAILSIGGRPLRWSIPLHALVRPFVNMRDSLKSARHPDTYYTWTK